LTDKQINVYLIISLGSIGKRHLFNLRQLDNQAKIIVLRHQKTNTSIDDKNVIEVSSMQDALDLNPTVAIIASPAVFHVEQALILLNHNIHLFIEKPLAHNLNSVEKLQRLAEEKSLIVMVGYVLRFSPALKKIKSLFDDGVIGSIINVSVHCGQYLPDWRPGQDYRQTVSARKELGGGVLLELSHEFDYLRWLFGDIDTVVANMVNTNTLEIDVEDRVDVLIKFSQGFSGLVHLNFLDKKAQRLLYINGLNGNISCDLINHKISIDIANDKTTLDLSQERNNLYLDELNCFLECVKHNSTPPIGISDGIEVVKIVEAIKQSSNTKKWVNI
jgi:predicted dehydrogenase